MLIHQIWMNPENELDENPVLPIMYKRFANRWKFLNPDWGYQLWNGKTMNDFIQRFYPEYYEFYKSLPLWIHRCDLFRYFIMYHYGGVYLDMDFIPLKRLDYDFFKYPICLFNDTPCGRGVNNCILASQSRQQFWMGLIQNIFESFQQNPFQSVIELTGPKRLTNWTHHNPCYIEKNRNYFMSYYYTDRDNHVEIEFHPDAYGIHLWDMNWKDIFS